MKIILTDAEKIEIYPIAGQSNFGQQSGCVAFLSTLIVHPGKAAISPHLQEKNVNTYRLVHHIEKYILAFKNIFMLDFGLNIIYL